MRGVRFRPFFFFLANKKKVVGSIRKVVVVRSNDCIGIGWDKFNAGRLRRVVVLWWLFEQV